MKYYIEEFRYCGPDARTDKYIDFDRFEVTTEPTRTNMSNEVCLDGWLGASGDVARYAHGVYDSLAAAEYAIQNLLGDEYRRDDEPSDARGVLAVYRPGRLSPIADDALDQWLECSVHIIEDAGNMGLVGLAVALRCELEDDGYSVTMERMISALEFLRRTRAREELED
ncbi:hypothetical protein [Thiolapillus sp.]|uniref:hypothetical protein n=1 Tax=Thiolapillus sp. TaxID=2017437 RepID=UPI003AF7469B